ncbi:MAG: hypothetical protein WC843_03580 [Candidatus Gracilibacteria bacterium]|jgi:hypothetical protein
MAEAEGEFQQFVCKGSDVEGDVTRLKERFPFPEGPDPYKIPIDPASPEFEAFANAQTAYDRANSTHTIVLKVLADDTFGPATNCPRREVTAEGDKCRTLVPTDPIDDPSLLNQQSRYEKEHPITHSLTAEYRPCTVSDQVRVQLGLKKAANAIKWEEEYDITPSSFDDRGRTKYELSLKRKGSKNFGHDYGLYFTGGEWRPDQVTLINCTLTDKKGFETDSAVAWANKNHPKPDPLVFPVEKSTPDQPVVDPLNFGP